MPGTGTLFVVATPIGNLDDLTGRAHEVLRDVAVIAAEDTRRTARLLSHCGLRTPTTSLHEHNEQRKSPVLIARLQRGDDVAVVSDAGTPTVSDPGRRLVRAALDAGIPVVPIPGPSAVMTALSASGFPADSFTFLGFPPVRSKDRNRWFDALYAAGRTVVFFESPHRIKHTLQAIKDQIGDVQLFLGREMTKMHEELVIGPISTILPRLSEPLGEYTVVLSLGETTKQAAAAIPCDADIAHEFGHMTHNAGLSRRKALATLARRYGLSPNDVYSRIERGKKLVKQQK